MPNKPLVGESTDPNTAGVLGEGPTGVYGRNKVNVGNGVIGYSDEGRGVWGHSNDKGIGVLGESVNGRGVVGTSQNDYGIRGHSNSIAGIRGSSDLSRGVEGWAKGSEGVVGITETGNGVWGQTEGRGIGVLGTSKGGVGVFGSSETQAGVSGQSTGSGTGVLGRASKDAGVTGFHGDPRLQETTVANNGAQAGVFGASDVGSGVVAYTRNRAVPALYAFGGLRSFASLNAMAAIFDGNVQVNGDIFLPGADCAEHFDMHGGVAIEPGSVVVINDDGAMRQSADAYDKKVAGVISGAGIYKPGIILDKQSSAETRQPVALVGKVYCKVDAQYSPISVGDLLTSSPTPGHAMKATDPSKAFGAVLGKALGSLAAGIGQVPILVCLQ
jgi:hypothetical protein